MSLSICSSHILSIDAHSRVWTAPLPQSNPRLVPLVRAACLLGDGLSFFLCSKKVKFHERRTRRIGADGTDVTSTCRLKRSAGNISTMPERGRKFPWPPPRDWDRRMNAFLAGHRRSVGFGLSNVLRGGPSSRPSAAGIQMLQTSFSPPPPISHSR